jgi:hypothetical protein
MTEPEQKRKKTIFDEIEEEMQELSDGISELFEDW